MKAHTLSLLSQLSESGKPIVESEIISWVNQTLKDAGKDSSIKNFQDSTIANAEVFIDLIDAIKPGVIYYENMRHGGTPEVTSEFKTCLVFMRNAIMAVQ